MFNRNRGIINERRALNMKNSYKKPQSEELNQLRQTDIAQQCTVGQSNQEYGLKYWAIRSSVRSHHSLVHLLCTTCFARALRCAHSLAHFAHSLTVNDWMAYYSVFFSILAHSAMMRMPRFPSDGADFPTPTT